MQNNKEIVGVRVERSFGQTKTGIPVFYIRPALACFNRSRRCVGYDKKDKAIEKWFSPEVKYYQINNCIIGSNLPQNALREFWRICEKEEVGQQFEIKPL